MDHGAVEYFVEGDKMNIFVALTQKEEYANMETFEQVTGLFKNIDSK